MRLVIALLIAAAAHAETSSYLATLGSWVLCGAEMTGPGCRAGGIPYGTYALFITTDTPAVGFRYSITVHLADGTTQTVPQRIIARAPEQTTRELFVFPSPVVSYEQKVEPIGVIQP